MVIKVQCACGACDEWAMIELQGEVKMQSQLEGGDEDGAVLDAHNVDLGEFCGDQASGKASFTIGYHRLEGKEIKLKKPLAILEAADDDGQQGRRTLKVVGVVRRKFHFKDRPRALIGPREDADKKKRSAPPAVATFFGNAHKKPNVSKPPPK
mmetsp:Transcript_13953/g.58261  ORF Transcript_13953/g.58261 Transcript_13953/m.58261 type:complete len:153 (-) Transcript_13953:23-481(-)|eukprot:PRCOL_00004746-RA